MLRYALRRILILIPTLLLISLLAFVITAYAPGEPEEQACDRLSMPATQTLADCDAEVHRIRIKLNRHLPLFYFRVASLSEPDTLYRVYNDKVRATLSRLLYRTGNWPVVHAWHQQLQELRTVCSAIVQGAQRLSIQEKFTVSTLSNQSNLLLETASPQEIEHILAAFHAEAHAYPALSAVMPGVQAQYEELSRYTGSWKTYVPWIIVYGPNNQYHCWLRGLFRLDLGRSHRAPYQPVADLISDHFFWSFLMTLLSVFLAYLISIPMGLLAAARRDGLFDRASALVVLALDSLPSFFTATLIMVIGVHVFGARYVTLGEMPVENHSIWNFLLKYPERLVLPLIAYTYGALAFLSRTMRTSLLEILQQDYIRTARAKGLSEWAYITRHALKNALLPIITIFATVFPALISGSIILEAIFDIPGMGTATLKAIADKDTPMIVAVFTLTGGLTVIGYLVADLLYTLVNPLIRTDQ